MIKETVLQPRLAEIGKIKVGGVGKELKAKSGNKYRQPTKFGHFVVTTTERDQSGNFKPDTEVMKTLGEKPRELSIRLLFDSIEMNLQTEFAMYHGKKKACSGDGEKAKRLKFNGKEITDIEEDIECLNFKCSLFKEKKCKVSSRLFCMIPQCMSIGGIHVFRTHSSNAAAAMTGALRLFKENTNGILQGLPLKLKMVKKQTEEHGEVDFVTIVLDGLEMMGMRKQAALELVNRRELGVNIEQYEAHARASGMLIDHDKPEDVEEEFYTQSEEQKKEPARGKSADDVAAAVANASQKPSTEKGDTKQDDDSSPV